MAQAATVQTQERGVNRWVGIGAVIFAALAAILLFIALQSRGGGGSSAVSTVDVVVASQAIDPNTTLTADMLTVKEIPADSLLDGAYADTTNVVGVPLRYPVQEGQQITSAVIGASEITEEDDVSYLLQPGQRAFAIQADEVSAVGGLLLAGNKVDIIAVFSNEGQEGSQRAHTVLQNITVLSVAQEAAQPVPAAADGSTDATGSDPISGERPDDIERQPDASSVTLAVTPDQVQLLAALQDDENATIWLALRGAGDNESPQLQPTNLFPYEAVPAP